MDKILRRVRMAERQVARRAKRRQELDDAIEKTARNREIASQRKQAGHELGAAIKARHEDLELGPIAPRRDVSKVDQFGNYWGSISTERALLQTKLTDMQREARAAWAGGRQYLCIAPGDRVVITEGPDKGKISTIKQIKRNAMAVELEGSVSMANAKIPSFLATEKDQKPVQPVKAVVPISAIRLVHPLPDPATGLTRDVIIRELKPVGITHDRPTRKVFFSRVVPGLNVRIPWPKQEPLLREDGPADTVRLDVEERTFVPTLLRPPMPESVLDELRNKYSKFRTRHTPEYIAEVEAREAAKAGKKGAVAAEMLLPVQEYNRKMREIRRARGKPELSEEMLEKIGEVIARNKSVRAGAKAAGPADAEVGKVQKAVEELSLGGDAQATTVDGEQPRV